VLRAVLEDAAVAAAKTHSHERIEPRHVLYAIARHFRERPDVAPLLSAARQALEPPGAASGPPAIGPDARVLLDSITTEQDAITALLNASGKSQGAGVQGGDPKPQQDHSNAPDVAHAPANQSAVPGPEAVGVVLAELEALIGLASVKEQVKSIIAVVQANQERVKAGLAPVNPGLHLVFTGPPGTGKTTVARLIARLYASTGALSGSRFTEASRADLVAGFVGQTAIKTTEVIDRTRPGVLFIDEAYALAPRYDSDFSAEAISTLVKAMEDHRNAFAVIAAGYADEMAEFIGSNPGLRSRFKTYIDFPDYGPDELVQIFSNFAKQAGIGIGDGVLDKAKELFEAEQGRRDFGNARFARSLFEHAYSRMAARAAADGTVQVEELMAIEVVDLDWKSVSLDREIRRIGFGGRDSD
jgi:Holliday junction resolvasome RuvABC ATP-dependent DNA helicase subunit